MDALRIDGYFRGSRVRQIAHRHAPVPLRYKV